MQRFLNHSTNHQLHPINRTRDPQRNSPPPAYPGHSRLAGAPPHVIDAYIRGSQQQQGNVPLAPAVQVAAPHADAGQYGINAHGYPAYNNAAAGFPAVELKDTNYTPTWDGDEKKFRILVGDLENWFFVKDIEWVLIRDDLTRAAACVGRNAVRKKKDQRTGWVAIFNAFKDHIPSYVQDVDKTQAEFATDVWKKIYEKYRPSDLAAATDLIADLEDAIVFNGEIEEYIKKIKLLKDRLAALNHPQDELLICRNIYNSILAYASVQHDAMERQWGSWIMTLKMNAPANVLSLQLIEDQGKEYVRHLKSAKKDAEKYKKSSTGGLANFSAYSATDGRPTCSYCNGPHQFNSCEKYKYDQRKREEQRGRSRERDFRERSNSRGRDRGRKTDRPDRGGSRPRSFSRGRSNERGRSNSRGRTNSSRSCYSCGDPSHLSPDCPFREQIKDFIEGLKRQKKNGGAYNATDRVSFSDRKRDRSRSRSHSHSRCQADRRRSIERDAPPRKPAALMALSEWTKQNNFVPMSASFKPYAGVHIALVLGKRRLREDENVPQLSYQNFEPTMPDIFGSPSEIPCCETDDDEDFIEETKISEPTPTVHRLSIRPLVWEDPNGQVIDEQFSDAANLPFWNYRTSPSRNSITDPDFPTRPNAIAFKVMNAGKPDSFSKAQHEDEHFMIVDSGCNNHYLARRDFLYRTENIDTRITGIGNNSVTATCRGIFAGRMTDDRGHDVDFESWGLFMPSSSVSLFSVVQAAFGGNHVVHEGHPVHGRHGMFFPSTNQFIPFEFCEETGLFWVRVRQREQEPVVFNSSSH